MKVFPGALSPCVVLFLASCTSVGEARWAAHEDPKAASPGLAARAEQRTSGFYADDAKNNSAGGLSLQTVYLLDKATQPSDAAPSVPPVKPKDRKMIYSASLQVRVSSLEDAVHKLLNRVEQLEGYLAQRNNNVLTCRIPAKSFHTFIQEVKEYGAVLHESMQAQDVTKQHLDLSIRLENAETARQRLLKLLEKATKVEDILKIEEQLTRLTETIERIKGELKFLNEQIAYSLVSVDFQSVSPSVQPTRRSRSRFDWINQVGIEQVLRRF